MINQLWERWFDCVKNEGFESDKINVIESEIYAHEEACAAASFPGLDKNKLEKELETVREKIGSYSGNNPQKFHGEKRDIESKLYNVTPPAPRNEGIYKLYVSQGRTYPFKIGDRYYFCEPRHHGLSRSGKSSSGVQYIWDFKPSSEIDAFREDVNSIEPKRGWKSKIMKAHSLTSYKQLDWYLSRFMSLRERQRLLD